MSYLDLQDTDDYTADVLRDPKLIVGGVDILAPENPKDPNRDRGDKRQALYELKQSVKTAEDKPYAFWEVFKAVYRQRLEQNAWSGEIYLRQSWNSPYKNATTPERLLGDLEDALKVSSKLTKDMFERKLLVWLERCKINPVRDYLQQTESQYPEPIAEWDNLAFKLFGVNDQLSQEMLSRWLIGAVKRAMEPGCQMDSALVVRGEQGVGKTSLLRALFGDHFVTLHSHQKDEEQKRMLGCAWGVELGELESITRVKDVEALKAFLSETDDIYRELYERRPTRHPRHCIFAGTANSTELLRDDTGSRRFWIIDAGSYELPVEWVKQNSDHIWATAYKLWSQNKPHWFDTNDLKQQSEERNTAYQTSNEFLDMVEALLGLLEKAYTDLTVKPADLLTYGFDVPVERHKVNKADKKVVEAVKKMGYVRKQTGRGRSWVYCKPNVTPTEALPGAVIRKVREEISVHGVVGHPARSRGFNPTTP